MNKLSLLAGVLAIAFCSGTGGALAQDSCTDGAPDYSETLADIGEDLSAASESGSFADMLQAADGGFETLVVTDPPSAFEEPHAYMLSALHNLAMAGLAYGLEQPEVASTYEEAANQRIEQFEETLPAALATCGG